jgi:phage tail-like protein|tara:strand:- start:742 stop:1185 length:444 start_codon:yes stop_codon:yes gene_type:complete
MDALYPPVGFHFRVEFDISGVGKTDTYFREVSGLSMELEEETVVEGGENRFVQRLPIRAKYPDLILKRGLAKDSKLGTWSRAAIQDLDIKTATIWVTLLNDEHQPLQTYCFVNAWPKKWAVSDFNAESSDIVIENLELAYQYYTVNS